MVSFSCEVCNDTITKKKLDQHAQRCYGAYFTCIDCSTTFEGTSYRNHTSCISEAEKYEKALYRGPKKKNQQIKEQPKEQPKKQPKEQPKEQPKKEKSPKEESPFTGLKENKNENLYKILKKASKDDSKKLKEILKSIKVVKSDGKIIIQ
ncbi:uncharacterized protein SPAPADRAFT_59029 [Spathaspora passalidarum NRRL Y-27907]|uniref:Zinc finger C2H2 LYAR-type domain-containing protein n=1 Tax=Spathaspora passalidarum (strain NRRL Y-27907 / 11-Y1) TaxID=619300 RepID=G3AI87_SPAPN|nr:uncharacterized protein SPAPADRAFT_59029 [Spathaspora passalidarum NRRL Y-27907]EGW33655.1 hypothetical protein SPAPADRAFT_59029 [Spathaspora passalidarum NRRL Y-27907]